MSSFIVAMAVVLGNLVPSAPTEDNMSKPQTMTCTQRHCHIDSNCSFRYSAWACFCCHCWTGRCVDVDPCEPDAGYGASPACE